MILIFLLEFGAYITSQIRLHGHRAELQGCSVVGNVLVGDPRERARDALLEILTFVRDTAAHVDNRVKAELIHRTSFDLVHLAVCLKDVDNDGATGVGVGFEEGEQVEVDLLIEWNAIFSFAVKLSNGVFKDLRSKLECLKDPEFIRMDLSKLWTKFAEKHLAVVNRIVNNQVQVGVDKDRP